MQDNIKKMEQSLVVYAYTKQTLPNLHNKSEQAKRNAECAKLMIDIQETDHNLLNATLTGEKRRALENRLVAWKLRYLLRFYKIKPFSDFNSDWATVGMFLSDLHEFKHLKYGIETMSERREDLRNSKKGKWNQTAVVRARYFDLFIAVLEAGVSQGILAQKTYTDTCILEIISKSAPVIADEHHEVFEELRTELSINKNANNKQTIGPSISNGRQFLREAKQIN